MRSSAIDYLYPKGKEADPPRDVTLNVPVRVGLAFAPGPGWMSDALTEDVRTDLLERVAAAFRGRENIGDIRVIPSTYVKPQGGFADLDRVAATFGVDLVVLISYDQAQFSDTGTASLAYWTLIGAYLVRGEKQQTRTVVDAAVFDIKSRTLLFNATGESRIGGRSTPVTAERNLREDGEAGFRSATENLVAKLDAALAEFQRQAASGTVRGPGTPAITFKMEDGAMAGGSSGGGGAAGPVEILCSALVAGAAFLARRPRRI